VNAHPVDDDGLVSRESYLSLILGLANKTNANRYNSLAISRYRSELEDRLNPKDALEDLANGRFSDILTDVVDGNAEL
jgi:hypothetical protein